LLESPLMGVSLSLSIDGERCVADRVIEALKTPVVFKLLNRLISIPQYVMPHGRLDPIHGP